MRYNNNVKATSKQFTLSADLSDALQRNVDPVESGWRAVPVVALESTILAHGFAYPANLELARQLEADIRSFGAIPATIAILDGTVHVGLSDAQLLRLCSEGASFKKSGATDLAVHVARGSCAATTVSATSVIAAAAGISVFATGGIGGVHRGRDGDISHDLVAMARCPLAVISAGAKAILDLPRTVEALETLGVLLIGFGCDEFPAFYTAHSGVRMEHRCDSIEQLARTLHTHWSDFGGGGALIANPIPADAALDSVAINAAIEDALRDAHANQITGKQLTPFLLRSLSELTKGKSVIANRALARNNAQLGAKLAIALQSPTRALP
jgi:pseudouridylate synthase